MIYFLSDAHLGSLATPHRRMQERRLTGFLDAIKHKAEAVYLLGDMFDFWHEFATVVPRGYTRFLGKLSELTDLGVEVHYFTGNHDLWVRGYLEEECGVKLHTQAETVELLGKVFYLSHGDGLGGRDRKYAVLRSVFHNCVCQRLFAALHPRWSMALGLAWAKHSRMGHMRHGVPPYMGENREPLVLYAKNYLLTHPDINYFVFGHRHIELDLMLSHDCRMAILGDWISQFTYATFDGEHFLLENYEEGETRL